jgi:hypothetical protein
VSNVSFNGNFLYVRIYAKGMPIKSEIIVDAREVVILKIKGFNIELQSMD